MVYNINKVKYLLTTIITVASLNMFASQTRNIEAKEAAVIFKNIGDWFKDTEKYSVAVEFRTFNGHDATVPHEFKQGYLKKYGKNFHSMIMGSETMQNENYQIIIDTSNKFIAIKNAEKNIWEKINPNIIQKGLINEQSFSLTELNDGFQLKMIPSKSSSINYYEINYDN